MVRGFSFQLLYRVVFFSFCLIFACFYHGGGSEYDRREDKTEPNKLKDEFNGKPLNVDVSLERDKYDPKLTGNAKQIDGEDTKKETDLSKMAKKGTVMKTIRSDRIRKSPEPHFLTPSPPEVKVPGQESTITSRLSETKWQNNDRKNISSLETQIFRQNDLRGTAKRETFASLTTQHLRNRREIDAISENKVGPTKCANFTFTIKYEDEYKVWNNFSMMYRERMYHYNEYRITDDGVQVCYAPVPFIQQKWQNFIAHEKKMTVFTHCNVSVDGFYFENYTLFKNFTVFFHPTEQNFTRQNYGVIFGHFAICSAKLSLSCNDDLVKVKYGDQYNVLQNFWLFYNNKMYDYSEYRFGNEGLVMCASNDSRIRAIWRTRNSWEKFKDRYKCYIYSYHLLHYAVNKQFTVYSTVSGQFFTRNDYAVIDGKPNVCITKLRPESKEYTQEDLLMCNDSIINIKYDDEYKVRTDFSILYKNKVYDYAEYRVLNDGINICNSTDNYVRNIWKVRNKLVKGTIHRKTCNLPILIDVGMIPRKFYTIRNDFSILILPTDQVITKYDYGVFEGKLIICKEKIMFYNLALGLQGIPPGGISILCAVALSIICVLLLLIVYCMLPEMRTLPGLNLMSLSFAVLLLLTYTAAFVSLYLRVDQLVNIPCDRIEITERFIMYSVIMNAVVNIYHLRKTFCGNTLVKCNTLVKSDENKWKTFLKYSVFSWGVPVIIIIVYIVLVKKDVLRFQVDITGCVMGNNPPLWLAVMEKYSLPVCLGLSIAVMFSFTAYRISQKLKASSGIAQKSNIVKKRNSFVILLKLSTTTAISLGPLLFENIHFDFDIKMGLFTVAFLSGVYIGVAFVFTRKNYRLLKKKYFPAKKKPVK
ncbi:Hypothetical predicted protein [Paramuricea clavata]|uniref:Uncharacterized protein n=1 Tax=Paramuricea clavata TaxID=317549 RepID=A0A6S7K933_PARCT|nr:Hypothetical predicted protein [Paramuricea clavata]